MISISRIIDTEAYGTVTVDIAGDVFLYAGEYFIKNLGLSLPDLTDAERHLCELLLTNYVRSYRILPDQARKDIQS